MLITFGERQRLQNTCIIKLIIWKIIHNWLTCFKAAIKSIGLVKCLKHMACVNIE